MSKHTPTPWEVSSAICGKHQTETVSIYHHTDEWTTLEVVETGCKCGDEALTKENAGFIVTSVNYHERLVEALDSAATMLEVAGYRRCAENHRALLAELLDTKKGLTP